MIPPSERPGSAAGASREIGLLYNLGRGFAALRVRNYRLYWTGQLISLTGTWMQLVSIPWLVLALGGTPIELGIVATLQFGPALFVSPFGGVLADRIDKRRALIASQAVSMILAATLFTLTAAEVIRVPMIMALALCLGLVTGIEAPMKHPLVADLVPRQVLPNAIALNSMVYNSARVVGPAIAGVTIAAGTAITGSATTAVAINFGVNVLSYCGVLAGLMLMREGDIRVHDRPRQFPSVVSSLREGLGFASRAPLVLWPLVIASAIAAFGFNFPTLLPLAAREVLALGADGYGALFVALGIGSLAGSVTLAFMRRRRVLLLILGGATVFGVTMLALGVARTAGLFFPLVAFAGYGSMLVINTVNAAIQANVTDALRGRVMALYVTVFTGSVPIGSLLAGGLAEVGGTPIAFLAFGGLTLGAVAFVACRLHRAAARGDLGVTNIDSSSVEIENAEAH